jgi:uncharacterized protein (UPF0332 family)
MTWDDAARDSLDAAKLLREAGHHRSCVSRAYYAAYARATYLLTPLADFPPQRYGPNHDDLPRMAADYLTKLTFAERQECETLLEQLYERRITADYRPGMTIAEADSLAAVTKVSRLFKILEARYG